VIAPAGAGLSPSVDLVFDPLGRLALPASGASISIAGFPTPIIVERETGYVH
jgi:hypothetical protein